MKLKSIAILMLLLLIPNPSLSGEITDTEWNILNYLVVTYYSSSARKVECTAYNLNGAPRRWPWLYSRWSFEDINRHT